MQSELNGAPSLRADRADKAKLWTSKQTERSFELQSGASNLLSSRLRAPRLKVCRAKLRTLEHANKCPRFTACRSFKGRAETSKRVETSKHAELSCGTSLRSFSAGASPEASLRELQSVREIQSEALKNGALEQAQLRVSKLAELRSMQRSKL